MKNYYINLVLIVILITSFSYIRAESLISFSGYVRTVNDTLPIVEKEIFINLNEEIQIVTNTDQNGYYFYSFDLDSINAISAVVGVLDCTGSLFVEEFNPLESSNIADFYICNGEINCQAFFDYFTDAENYKQIYFINLSLGNYNSLLWDFGDGTFSNEDTPTKVFNEDGIYPVSLYIYDTVGECESSFTQTIFVFENDTTNCIAEFSYFETGIVENEVQFLDMSSFNIDNWYWDFGDGTDSYEQNPIHIYSDKGTYTVSLFVYSNISQCDDVITKTVVIDDTVNCYADFEYELDTLNNTPYTYIFNDASTQGTIEWYWDFGDGNFSTEQNPVHTYENPGNYNVCLTSMSGQPIANCIDLVCKEISTPAYYNFGGHAFIDGFTINIDENDSSNKATAYLYRKYENQWKYMDKRDFWKFGYYWFVQKPEGEYMLRFELDNTSKDYDNYAPSYYGDKTSWTYASSFDLQSDNQFAINVNLVKLKGLAAGSGSISGSLVSDETCVQEIDLADKIVKLFKDDDYVLFTKTDNFGRYEFGSLPLGNYILQAEISGLLSTVEKVQITDNEPFSEDNQLVLACDAYVGLEEIVFNSTTLQLENVYPVPAKDFIIFSFISYEEDEITIELSDLLGKEIGKYKFQLVHNNSEFIINLENSDASIVLYKIISSDGNLISNGKFVRNNQ